MVGREAWRKSKVWFPIVRDTDRKNKLPRLARAAATILSTSSPPRAKATDCSEGAGHWW